MTEPCRNCGRETCRESALAELIANHTIACVCENCIAYEEALADCDAHTRDWYAEAKALRDRDRWISVSERLPDESVRVLIAFDKAWEPHDLTVQQGYTFCGKWWRDGDEDKVKHVRFWRPLPDPPEEP